MLEFNLAFNPYLFLRSIKILHFGKENAKLNKKNSNSLIKILIKLSTTKLIDP